MARLSGIPIEPLDEDPGEFLRILNQRPPLAAQLEALHEELRTERILPDRLLELVRLRIAFWNQCRSCMATRFPEAVDDGLTEDVVCSLERPEEAEDLTDAERSAIAYADLMATDHLAVDDTTFADLKRHFSDAEIVELAINVAFNIGVGRMTATLDVDEGLPDSWRSDGDRLSPWAAPETVVAPPRQ